VDEIDLDSSDRIGRRVAHGVYRITHNKREIGEELWGVFSLREGGYRLMSEIDLKWPVLNQQRSRLDLDANWRASMLWVQIDAQGLRRQATYVPDGEAIEVAVLEQPLRYTEATETLREGVPAKTVLETRIPTTQRTLLDFGSTLFNFAHLKVLPMREGESLPMTALVPRQPSLEPLQIKQTYTFARVEQIANSINGYDQARRYVIAEEGDHSPVTVIWTDLHGITLRQQIQIGDATHGCELVSYRWHD
jgi:hypothetical protein